MGLNRYELTMTTLAEADVETAALRWQTAYGPDIAVDTPNAERTTSPRYIIDLIKRITTVSVLTVEIVQGLPQLPI